MAIHILKTVIGWFNFRNHEIAALELQQKGDAANLEPLGDPYTSTTRSGVVLLNQAFIEPRSLPEVEHGE